jgi:hypothetical protein
MFELSREGELVHDDEQGHQPFHANGKRLQSQAGRGLTLRRLSLFCGIKTFLKWDVGYLSY